MPQPIPTDDVSLAAIKERLYDRSVLSDEDSCWLWLGGVDGSGYGTLSISGEDHKVHRLSYQLHTEPIPPGLHVLHHCDQRNCINPYHLFVGTNADNVADKVKKGRLGSRPKGEDNHFSKLTADDVQSIRSSLAQGEGPVAIAQRYSISRSMVWRIAKGMNWKHLPQEGTTNE